jgi:hypothetical protein
MVIFHSYVSLPEGNHGALLDVYQNSPSTSQRPLTSQLSRQRRPRRAARFARGAAAQLEPVAAAITWRKTRLEIARVGHLPELFWLVGATYPMVNSG